MPKLPFPFPSLSLGTDLTSLSRIRSIITRQPGQASRFAHKILHPLELRDLERRLPGWQQQDHSTGTGTDAVRERMITSTASSVELEKLVTFLAGRWAAKEATRKAVGAHLLGQREVRVESTETGGVHVVYPTKTGALAEWEEEGVEQVGLCSISHDTEYAIASVLAVPLEGAGVKDSSTG